MDERPIRRIGFLSDSHGQAATTRQAVRVLIAQGVDLLIHLGDVETVQVIDALVESLDASGNPDPPVRIVFGNVDFDADALADYARHLGIAVDHPAGRVTAAGKVVAYHHGHRGAEIKRALDEQADYFVHGHSHLVRDEMVGRTRMLNPGALYRASRYTVGVLDAAANEWRVLEVPAE